MNSSYTLGCLSTAATIIIGAAGGHNKTWPQERKDVFQKASFYQFMSSAGMIVGSYNATFNISTVLFGLGICLFSGSLYHKAFTGKEDLSKRLPPFGGMCMILGWVLLSFKK